MYNADGSAMDHALVGAHNFESAYGDTRFSAQGKGGADHSDPNERFRSHTESVSRWRRARLPSGRRRSRA